MSNLQGFYIYGELRLVKPEGDYASIYVLPNDSTDSFRLSIRSSSPILESVTGTNIGAQVAFRVTAPRIATSRRTGNRYLAGLQILEFFAE